MQALKKIGIGIGVICVPITFFDTVGLPSVVFGSSMEVIHNAMNH